MSTIEIHEPEVQQINEVKPETAALLPRTELVLGPPMPPRPMFADSVLDFGVQRKRKFFATSTSFLINCLVIMLMLAVPLMFTEELPKAQLLTFLVAPPPPPPPPPPAAAEVHVVKQIQTDLLNNGALRTPTKIPQKIQMIKEEEAPPPMASNGGVVGGVPGGIPGGQLGGVIGSVISSSNSLAAVPKFVPATPTRVRISRRRDQGLADSTRGTYLPDPGPRSAGAGRRRPERGHRHQRTNSEPATGQRSPHAGAGGHRSRQTVALQAVPLEWATGRGRDHDHRDLHPLLLKWGRRPLGAPGV